jgi:hypothetical protein
VAKLTPRPRKPVDVARLLRQKKGLLLDISLGGATQPRSVSLQQDVCNNPLVIPFSGRLPDACVHTCVVTHVLEYLDPSRFFDWWDDLWRLMQPWGVVYVSGPYGGDESFGWLSDPQHKTRILEHSFAWLDPRTPHWADHPNRGRAYPRPWHTQTTARVPVSYNSISYNVVMQKVPMEQIAIDLKALKQGAPPKMVAG